MFEADGDGLGVNLYFKGWMIIIAIDIKGIILMRCPEYEMTLVVSRCATTPSADAGPGMRQGLTLLVFDKSLYATQVLLLVWVQL